MQRILLFWLFGNSRGSSRHHVCIAKSDTRSRDLPSGFPKRRCFQDFTCDKIDFDRLIRSDAGRRTQKIESAPDAAWKSLGGSHAHLRVVELSGGAAIPIQTWRAFLDNHFRELVSIDFLTVPTATFRVLYVLVVLAHDRRRVVHFNVTEHPTAAWTAQQIIESFQRNASAAYLEKVYCVLPPFQDAFIASKGRAYSEREAAAGFWSRNWDRRSRRATSPLRAASCLMNWLKIQARRSFGEAQEVLPNAGVQDTRECGSNIERNRVGKQNQKRTVRHVGDHQPGGNHPAGMGSRACCVRRSWK